MEKQTNNGKKIAAILCGYALFGLIAWAVTSGTSAGFDEAVRAFILSLRTSVLNAFFVPFAYSGNWFVVVPICLVLLILPRTRWAYGIPVSASVAVAQIFYNVLKRVFCRERPDWALHLVKEHGFSFPSGHSITSCMLFAMLAILILYNHRRKGRSLPIYKNTPHPTKAYFRSRKAAFFCAWLCFLYILLMGFARVYVGVHWPTDVLASWCLAVSNLTWLTWLFLNR
ncbi:MAG: phosphatase PAP2 family protein [Clostridia bacterium]|nr:phosphatase PAP2 family protein [Clostridia bacterium]